jgi:rare lipoprotein A
VKVRLPRLQALLVLVLAAGCASERPLPTAAEPVPQGRSPYGNGPVYEVHGRRYVVRDSSHGYNERGIASWYGKKFHGRLTSSREPYDMYAMTAAHKTLPFPTWVRVTNLGNNRSVVVRVNDRGPFVADRIIDLSYAAARELDIIAAGTALVEVTAVDGPEPAELVAQAVPQPPAELPADVRLYLQVGAFGDVENARRRFALLQDGGVEPAFVHEDIAVGPALYRVRIGPIADAVQYDSIVMKLRNLGISEMQLVTD